MSLTLTTDILTRNAAVVVIVPRRRTSWPVAMNYSPTGEQEESI